MTDEEQSPSQTSPQARISNAMSALLREWTGRGPMSTATTITADLVAVRMEGVLLKAEAKLVEANHQDAVLDMRRRFQTAMREPMVALVEEILDRKVRAFLSDQHFNPDIAMEIFVLAPGDEIEPAGDFSDPRD
jgi:uncharacterized protein YbcI